MNCDNEINLSITNIKNIKQAELSLPLEKGMFALVGENGCGKSTLMLCMSLIVKTSSAKMIKPADISSDSKINIVVGDKEDCWTKQKYKDSLSTGKYSKSPGKGFGGVLFTSTHKEGFYEGSIFYGSRFNDFNVIDNFLATEDFEQYLVKADSYVTESLGYILHNDKAYYKELLRINSKDTAKKFFFKGTPYFVKFGDSIVSQYRMSSGESMLISLIHFLNNVVVKNPKRKDTLLVLIDEVELALHPGAIDRLVSFLNELLTQSSAKITIYFSTHSAELLHRISARNIYLIENNNGVVDVVNPCYPNYAIRNLYIPNGFDFLLLVEDELAKALVEKVIRENSLRKSKLCCVLPAGGCNQMLKLHRDMMMYNTLGVGKQIVSIYDGDVKDSISEKEDFKSLKKCFLPIPSVEKYLKKKLITEPDSKFIKLIGDKYFIKRSLNDIIFDYKNDERTKQYGDKDGKALYKVLLANLSDIGYSQEKFIGFLCDDIYDYEQPLKFVESLKSILE